MRSGKLYAQFPGFGLAPNSNQFYGVPYVCSWSIYLRGITPVTDLFLELVDADLEVDVQTAACRWRGDVISGGDVWGCVFGTRVLPDRPHVEFSVRARRADGLTVLVSMPRVLEDVGLWSPGGGFLNPDPPEWVLPPEFTGVNFIGVRPTQRRELP